MADDIKSQQVVDALTKERDVLRAQRDALLAALKEIVAATDSDEWNPVSTAKARAAIKKAEEGK